MWLLRPPGHEGSFLQKRPEGVAAGLFALRLGLAAVFVVSGYRKLTGLSGTEAFFASVGIPAPGLFAPLVAVAEFFGGLGLALGILPRFSAAALALNMVVAMAVVTWPARGFDGSRLELMLLAAATTVLLAGPGPWTLPAAAGRPTWDVETPIWRRLRGHRGRPGPAAVHERF